MKVLKLLLHILLGLVGGLIGGCLLTLLWFFNALIVMATDFRKLFHSDND